MQARIRYLAILSERPDELASFYKQYLDMEELGRSNDGDVSLTDGFYNLTILNQRPELGEPRMECGLHHIGLQVDSIAEVTTRYRCYHPRGVVVEEPGGLHFGDVRIFDPECNPVTLSEGDFGVGGEVMRLPRIAHVAMNALDPQRILDFYLGIFGSRQLRDTPERRMQGKLNRFAGDGVTNLAIHLFYSDFEGHEARFGINHFGFLVDDQAERVRRLKESYLVAERPEQRPYAEFRFRDPDGNALDLSQTKGWEVDTGKWITAA